MEKQASNQDKSGADRDAKGRYVRGHAPTNQHVPIRHTATKIKKAFFEAFERTGGVEGLLDWINSSRHNKKEFYKMVLTVLPKDLDIKAEGFGDVNVYNIIRQIQRDISGDSSASMDLDQRPGIHEG